QGRDAVLLIGDPNSPNSLLVTSGSNTVSDVVQGLTLNLTGTSDTPVSVTVEKDVESIVTNVKTFVKTINDTLDQIRDLTKFVPETGERGLLLGNNTVQQVESALYAEFVKAVNDQTLTITRPAQIGLTIG